MDLEQITRHFYELRVGEAGHLAHERDFEFEGFGQLRDRAHHLDIEGTVFGVGRVIEDIDGFVRIEFSLVLHVELVSRIVVVEKRVQSVIGMRFRRKVAAAARQHHGQQQDDPLMRRRPGRDVPELCVEPGQESGFLVPH